MKRPAAAWMLGTIVATGLPAIHAAPGPDPAEFTLALAAKRLCSGLFVSDRSRDDVMTSSIPTFLDADQRRALETGALGFDVDGERGIVTAHQGDVRSRARHFGDQGCVILRRGSDKSLFTPVSVTSTLPPADETPWPMGDVEAGANVRPSTRPPNSP